MLSVALVNAPQRQSLRGQGGVDPADGAGFVEGVANRREVDQVQATVSMRDTPIMSMPKNVRFYMRLRFEQLKQIAGILQTGHAAIFADAELRIVMPNDKQPFFHSIPGMPLYEKRLDRIRRYQEAFVAKMLSYSLDHGNVLYCMNNETSTPAKWGQFWIRFIKERAESKGVSVCTSDMFDETFEADKGKHTPIIFEDVGQYMFADISQVNVQVYDDQHWKRLQLLLRLIDKHPRPTNHVKIYSGGFTTWGSGSLEDGVERFWRDILGGSAAVRFHRAPDYKPLSDRNKSCIRAARLMTTMIDLWDISPHMKLLSQRSDNEAYLAANAISWLDG